MIVRKNLKNLFKKSANPSIEQKSSNNENLSLYYLPTKKEVIETYMNREDVPFDTMIRITKERLDIEKKRLNIISNLGHIRIQSNNVIPNEIFYKNIEMITNNELNNMLITNNNKRNLYLELLEMDLDEYYKRYKRHYTGKFNRLKLDKIFIIINRYIDEAKKTHKYAEIKSKIKKLLKEQKVPTILFDLFRTRKGVRNLREERYKQIKDINHTLMETETKNDIKTQLKQYKNNQNLRLGNSDIVDFLGINKIIKYTNATNKNNSINKSVYNEISDKIIDYMFDIDFNDINNIDSLVQKLRDPLFIRKQEYKKMDIAHLMLSNFDSPIDLYETFTRNTKNLGFGYSAIVVQKNNNVFKFENLKFKLVPDKFIENFKKKHHSFKPRQIYYLFNNYEVFTLFIQAMINEYLYKINSKYVPEFISYSFSYKDSLTLTKTKNGFRNSGSDFTGDFMEFIINEADNENYLKNVLIILKETCKVLKTYQEKCFFVHGDCHTGNILVICNFDEYHVVKNVRIKLIDLRFSSVLLNINGKLKLLKDIGFTHHTSIEFYHPYISSLWNKIDILAFLSDSIYNFHEKYQKNENIKNMLFKLLDIMNMKKDSYEMLSTIGKEEIEHRNYMILFKKKDIINLLKNNENFDNFIPHKLEFFLENYIKNI